MASSSEYQMQHEMRRIPVPNYPATVLMPASGPGPGPIVMPGSTAGIPAQGPHHSNGPIPIITTLPQQPTQYQFQSQTHLHSQPHQPQQLRGPTIVLSPQMEEDLKAAVLGTMAPTQPAPSQQMPKSKEKEVRMNRWLRWTSVVLCVAIIVTEAALAIAMGSENDTVYGLLWGTLLGIWDLWQLIRSRRKKTGDPVSIWQVVGEGSFMVVSVAMTGILVTSSVSAYGPYEVRIRSWVLTFVFLVLAIFHIVFFIHLCSEKWSKQNHQLAALPLYQDPKQQQQQQPLQQAQVPQFIVQYVHECPHCGNQLGPQPGEDVNADLASKGDAQPQSIAPAYLR
ncbi:hypothetical protein F4810DRAFT_713675 [Camillea tinctor]|nr:hypothetical protein F4810DRAFT_713675 [Camillea tinctor]